MAPLNALIHHANRSTHGIVVGVRVECVIAQKHFTIKAHTWRNHLAQLQLQPLVEVFIVFVINGAVPAAVRALEHPKPYDVSLMIFHPQIS